MDFATVWNDNAQTADWLLAGPDLASDSGLDTAVILSLLTDKLAPADADIPDGTTDRRGTWMDTPIDATTQSNGQPDYMGSWWWLLSRAKATEQTRQNFIAYTQDALQWMIDDGVAASVTVQAGWVALGFLAAIITIARITGPGKTVNRTYDAEWNATTGGSVTAASVPYTAPPPLMIYPDPPVGLTVGTTTTIAVGLSWTVSGTGGTPASYVVQISPHGAATWTTAATITAPTTSVTITGLTSGTAYDFQVYAVNATGASSPCALVTGITATNAPNAPTSLAASAGSPSYSAVGLSWTASAVDGTHDAAATYTVQYKVTGAGSWSTFATGVTGTTETVTGLVHATAYSFQVLAVNAGGSTASATVNKTTTTAAPNVPTGLAAGTLTALTTTSIAITWTASAADSTHDAAATYTVQYRTDPSGSWTQVTGITGAGTTITGLTSATEYDFQVLAVNAGGSSAYTATATGTTFTNAITLNYVSPASPFTPSSGPGVNITVAPNSSKTRAAWGSSATVEPTTGWVAGSSAGGSNWGWYLTVPGTAGTIYLWIEAQTSGSVTTGLQVTGPYTVT